jgi:hypothetical protein
MEDLRRVEMLEVPGCPEGSMKAIAYIKEKQPNEVVFKTPDEGCVAVLRVVLPLFNYFVVDVYVEGDKHAVKARRGRT